MRALTWIALVLSGLVLPGCNAGVGGILLAVFLQDDDHHGRKAREAALAAAELVDLENERTRPDDTIILLRLRNAEEEPADLFVELSAGGEPFRSITLRPLFPQLSTGPGRLTGLATSSAGVVHRIGWHALRDLGTDELRTVTLRFTGDLVEPLEAVVVIGNDAPAILEVGTTQPEGGDVRVFVALTDSSSDPSDVLLEFAVGPEVEGGDEGSPPRFEPATVVGDAIGLETSPSGVAHAFGWAAVQDAGPFDRPARIRLTPIDRIEGEVGKTGASVEREIVLDSNARPRVEILAEEVLAGEDQRRGIALRFIVRDGESDPVDAVVQWAPDGGPFPELDAALDRDPAARAALLANPQARRPLQVATLAVEMLEGTVEEPAAGALGSDSVLASWLRAEGELRGLAAGALAGRRLELLQPGSEAPEAQHRVACAYSAADGVLRADRPFDPPAAPGALLRIALGGSEGSLRLASSPEGVAHRLAWDAQADLPGGGPVRFRITPFDRAAGDGSECVAYGPSPGAAPGDRGVASDLGGVKRLRGPFPEGDAWAVPIAAIDVPAALAAGDLNGDGRVDLACAARGSDSVVLLFQSTPGVFDTLRLADSGLAGAASLVVRDLDSDGDLDLAACGEESGKVLVIRQLPGFDFFADRSALTAGGTLVRPAALAAEDLDSDGDADLAVIEAGGADRGVVVFFGESGARGAGCGAAEGGYRACVLRDPAQGTARAIAAAKVDLDSTLDLVTAGDGFFAVYALSYAGAEVRYTVTRVDAPGTDLRSVAVADLDRDGLPDLVGADRAGSALRVASQGLGLTFDLGVPLASPHLRGPLAVAGADLDSNGVVDLAAADPGDPATGFGGNVCVFLGDAAGRYSGDALTPPPRPGAPPASPRAVAAADVDGDGRLDVVTADDGTHEVVVYRQGGRGTFRAPAEALAEGQVLPEPSSLAAFDSDGDARLDLLAASRPADALVLLRQTDGGDFAALQLPLPAPEGADDAGGMRRGPVAAAAGDLDGDALADIVAASVDSNDLTVLLRDAEGSYVLSDVKAEGFLGPHSVALADLDGDGLLDVACAARFSDEARWFRQGAGGSFAEAGAFRAPEGSPQKLLGPVFVAAGDVDSDGRADVVTANHRSGNLTIFLQAEEPEGRGTFGAPVEVPLGAGARPVALTLGRLGEGSGLDIATVNLGRAAASVVLQDGAGMLRVTSLGGLSGVQPTAIALRELGGDGRPDLAIAFSGASASFLQVRAQGAGAGEPAFDGVLRLAARELIAPAALIAADLDSDGEADLAAASRATRAITVFYGGR